MGAIVTKIRSSSTVALQLSDESALRDGSSAVTAVNAPLSQEEQLRMEFRRTDGIINLENRAVTNETFVRYAQQHQTYTRNIVSLSLAANRITSLNFLDPTNGTCHWTALENLDLSGNAELFVYSGITELSMTLKNVRLSNNGLFKVPTEIWSLLALMKLDLSHNRLQALPSAIGTLSKLHSLKLCHNSLSALPEALKCCTRLRRLDLSFNKFTELPVNKTTTRRTSKTAHRTQASESMESSIFNPTTLHSLAAPHGRNASISLSSNNMSTLRTPAAIPNYSARTLPALSHKPTLPAITDSQGPASANNSPLMHNRTLAHSSNNTNSPPLNGSSADVVVIKYFDPARISYVGVTLLNLSNNQLESLSPSIGLLRSLNILNLGNNKLRSLPTEIALLTELKYLDLRFNSLQSVITEVCHSIAWTLLRVSHCCCLVLTAALFVRHVCLFLLDLHPTSPQQALFAEQQDFSFAVGNQEVEQAVTFLHQLKHAGGPAAHHSRPHQSACAQAVQQSPAHHPGQPVQTQQLASARPEFQQVDVYQP